MFQKILTACKQNWKSGLSIAVVSVPLSISFAIASGGTPVMGLITSAWAGLAAALLGGSNFNVISPAGAFAGILSAVALTHGVGAIPTVTIAAGIMMFMAYQLKAQRFLRFIPGGAIFGFTLGIAGIIAGTQINSAFGLVDVPEKESILLSILESIKHLGSFDLSATLVFACFLVLLLVLKAKKPNLPGVIIVTPIALLVGYLSTINIIPLSLETLGSLYGPLSANLIQTPHLLFDAQLLIPALTIAVVGILETMLSAKIADNMTGTRHDQPKEMFGLSIANIVSGLVGGMPATGVLGPTTLNISTGATNRMSAAIKAIFVAVITLVLFSWFQYIPMPAIAAILFFVAISMVESKRFLLYYQHDRFALFIASIVALITIARDPALGILVGSTLGLLTFAERVSRGSYEAVHNRTIDSEKVRLANEKHFYTPDHYDIMVYSFRGVLTHLNGEGHIERLSTTTSKVSHAILRLREITYLDLEGIQALDTIIQLLQKKSITVYVTTPDPHVRSQLRQHSQHFEHIEPFVASKTKDILTHLGVPNIE